VTRRLLIFTGVVSALAATAQAAPAKAPRDPSSVRAAVVKIFTTQQNPSYWDPWQPGWVQSPTGSGCLISERRILTNAHVVSNSTFLQVRRYGQAEKHTARVLFVSHEADLALLTVDEPAFFEGVEPLPIGDLPPLQQEVAALGFPAGGDSLSVTRGVLSRIEHIDYVHSAHSLLAGQIDAALNPGNSGGPVVVDGSIVGIAMQVVALSQNIAYMVPTPVIRHFLTDVADGRYAGIPRLGVRTQPMENPDLRHRYLVPDTTTGVLVLGTLPGFPAGEHLRAGDVLLSIDGHAIANDGTVEFRPRERTALTFYTDGRQIGDAIAVAFLREGRALSATIPLTRPMGEGDLVGGPHYDTRPAYYLFGGLVFAPLTTDYVSMWGNAYPQISALSQEPPTFDGQEILVLSRVLAAEANEGYHELVNLVVTAVDGKKPANLAELVRLVEEGQSSFVTFSASDGREVILDRARAREAGPAIMKLYLVQSDRFLPPPPSRP
jgi:S1-C subfamily serine protease